MHRSSHRASLGVGLLGLVAWATTAAGCGRSILLLDEDDAGGSSTSGRPGTDGRPEPPSDADEDDDGTIIDDFGQPGCGDDCVPRLDVLYVIDNSRTMGEEQRTLARTAPQLVAGLVSPIDGTRADVQIMVTTTDVGNPLCTPFQPPGYFPARGQPVSTSCLSRIDDFEDLTGQIVLPEACYDVCNNDVSLEAPFIAIGPDGSNVPDDGQAIDIDGDGVFDPPEARALACMLPQGINGCGFESPLEAMRLALDPSAEWNQGPAPFLRPDVPLMVVIVTDEVDCSVADFSIMEDPAFWNVDPQTGLPAPSSAICWNAGVVCSVPDDNGVFPSCLSRSEPYLHPVEDYVKVLEVLRADLGKDVAMLELVGVPEVVAHDPNPPYHPIAGGVYDLVYRGWIDLPYPNGDIPLDEWANGIRAADKHFEFGIGPGCTGVGPNLAITTQATPPVRLLEVCAALDRVDAEGQSLVRCAVESVCGQDYGPAMNFVGGQLWGVGGLGPMG